MVYDQNVWYRYDNPSAPKFKLIELEYSDLESYRNAIKSFNDEGYVQAMPFGELAYYVRRTGILESEFEIEKAVRFYIDNDSWPSEDG